MQNISVQRQLLSILAPAWSLQCFCFSEIKKKRKKKCVGQRVIECRIQLNRIALIYCLSYLIPYAEVRYPYGNTSFMKVWVAVINFSAIYGGIYKELFYELAIITETILFLMGL